MPRELIGLVPAAGRAARLGRLPCSKEIVPVGFERGPDGVERPRPVIHGLLRGFAAAGIHRVLVVLRDGKWDVAALLGDGSELGLDLAYLVVEASGSVPETLDRARAWIDGCDVALGFPDILIEPADAWPRLVDFHREQGCDVALCLFPTDQSDKADMVDFDDAGRIREIVIKDPACAFRWTWSIAVLAPVFWDLLSERVRVARSSVDDGGTELWVGDVVRAAIGAGLDVRGRPFPEGSFLDVGTPGDMRRAVAEAVQKGRGAGRHEV